MFEGLLEALKALVSAASKLSELDKGRRSNLAAHFDAIAQTLVSILERRNKGEKSIDLCAELGVYAKKIHEVSRSTLSKVDLLELVSALEQAQHSRAMLYYVTNPSSNDYDEFIDQLSETAGLLRGLANTLRAK